MSLRARRPSAPKPSRAELRGEPSRLIDRLRADLYAAPEWVVCEEVRTSTGCPDSLRRADAIAVRTTPPDAPWHLEAFEAKTSRADLARELANPAKISPFALFCACVWIVVSAPRKAILPSLLVIPEMWGVIEIGTGGVEIVRAAVVRKNVEEPTPAFLRALLRAASAPVAREARGDGDAPLRAIVGRLSRDVVALACGHRALRPLGKVAVALTPCPSCAAGLPSDPEVIADAIEAADPATLESYRARVDALLGVRVLPGPALASCGAPEPLAAAEVA